MDHKAGILNILTTKDAADVDFTQDAVDVVMKAGKGKEKEVEDNEKKEENNGGKSEKQKIKETSEEVKEGNKDMIKGIHLASSGTKKLKSRPNLSTSGSLKQRKMALRNQLASYANLQYAEYVRKMKSSKSQRSQSFPKKEPKAKEVRANRRGIKDIHKVAGSNGREKMKTKLDSYAKKQKSQLSYAKWANYRANHLLNQISKKDYADEATGHQTASIDLSKFDATSRDVAALVKQAMSIDAYSKEISDQINGEEDDMEQISSNLTPILGRIHSSPEIRANDVSDDEGKDKSKDDESNEEHEHEHGHDEHDEHDEHDDEHENEHGEEHGEDILHEHGAHENEHEDDHDEEHDINHGDEHDKEKGSEHDKDRDHDKEHKEEHMDDHFNEQGAHHADADEAEHDTEVSEETEVKDYGESGGKLRRPSLKQAKNWRKPLIKASKELEDAIDKIIYGPKFKGVKISEESNSAHHEGAKDKGHKTTTEINNNYLINATQDDNAANLIPGEIDSDDKKWNKSSTDQLSSSRPLDSNDALAQLKEQFNLENQILMDDSEYDPGANNTNTQDEKLNRTNQTDSVKNATMKIESTDSKGEKNITKEVPRKENAQSMNKTESDISHKVASANDTMLNFVYSNATSSAAEENSKAVNTLSGPKVQVTVAMIDGAAAKTDKSNSTLTSNLENSRNSSSEMNSPTDNLKKAQNSTTELNSSTTVKQKNSTVSNVPISLTSKPKNLTSDEANHSSRNKMVNIGQDIWRNSSTSEPASEVTDHPSDSVTGDAALMNLALSKQALLSILRKAIKKGLQRPRGGYLRMRNHRTKTSKKHVPLRLQVLSNELASRLRSQSSMSLGDLAAYHNKISPSELSLNGIVGRSNKYRFFNQQKDPIQESLLMDAQKKQVEADGDQKENSQTADNSEFSLVVKLPPSNKTESESSAIIKLPNPSKTESELNASVEPIVDKEPKMGRDSKTDKGTKAGSSTGTDASVDNKVDTDKDIDKSDKEDGDTNDQQSNREEESKDSNQAKGKDESYIYTDAIGDDNSEKEVENFDLDKPPTATNKDDASEPPAKLFQQANETKTPVAKNAGRKPPKTVAHEPKEVPKKNQKAKSKSSKLSSSKKIKTRKTAKVMANASIETTKQIPVRLAKESEELISHVPVKVSLHDPEQFSEDAPTNVSTHAILNTTQNRIPVRMAKERPKPSEILKQIQQILNGSTEEPESSYAVDVQDIKYKNDTTDLNQQNSTENSAKLKESDETDQNIVEDVKYRNDTTGFNQQNSTDYGTKVKESDDAKTSVEAMEEENKMWKQQLQKNPKPKQKQHDRPKQQPGQQRQHQKQELLNKMLDLKYIYDPSVIKDIMNKALQIPDDTPHDKKNKTLPTLDDVSHHKKNKTLQTPDDVSHSKQSKTITKVTNSHNETSRYFVDPYSSFKRSKTLIKTILKKRRKARASSRASSRAKFMAHSHPFTS